MCMSEKVLQAEVVQSEKYLREKLASTFKEYREQCVWNIVSKEENGETKSEKQAYELIIYTR